MDSFVSMVPRPDRTTSLLSLTGWTGLRSSRLADARQGFHEREMIHVARIDQQADELAADPVITIHRTNILHPVNRKPQFVDANFHDEVVTYRHRFAALNPNSMGRAI